MPRSWRWVLVGLHALVVALLIALFYLATATGPETDANIGAGFMGLALLGLGLPWTMLLWIVEPHVYNGLSPAVRGLVGFGPAAVNVLIHGVLSSGIWNPNRRRSVRGVDGARTSG